MNLIYHIVRAADWAEQEAAATYSADSLRTEKFIHLSKKEQVAGVLKRYYQHEADLLLLHVDADRLTSELRYEQATNDDYFPHLYGPLNKDAIVTIEQLR